MIHYVNVITIFLVQVTLTKKERSFSTGLLDEKSEFAFLTQPLIILDKAILGTQAQS